MFDGLKDLKISKKGFTSLKNTPEDSSIDQQIAQLTAENVNLSNQIIELEKKQEEISAMKLHFLGMSSSQVFESLQTSAVCWAASLGDINSLQMLLDNGVDILRPNYDGRTALHLAVSGGQVECIRFLFAVGAQMVADNSGHTALQQAIQEGRQDLAMEINALLCEQQKRSIDAMYADSFDYFDGKSLTKTAPAKKERKHRRDRSDPLKDESKSKKFSRAAPREIDQFGVRRGGCMVPDCDCKRYTEKLAEDKVTICTCAHFPASHKFLSKVDAMSSYGFQEIESVNNAFVTNSLIKWDANQVALWPRKFNLEITPLSMEFQIKFQKFIESSDLNNVGALDVKFWSSLGSGSSAEVFKAEWKNVIVALKVVLFSNAALKTESVVNEFQHELDVLSKIKHPNCLECFGVISRPRICFVLEYCEKGSMYDILTKSIYKLDWTNLFRWFINVLEGLSYLHNFQPCVLHRDIKSKNLLIDAEDNVKLADFGTARFLIQGESEVSLGALRGTYSYTAPEIYFGAPFTVECDIYSLGVLLWELVYKCITGDYLLPYNEYSFIVHDFQIIILSAKRNIRPTIPVSTPLQIKKIIKLLWNARPEKRPRLAKLRSYFDLLYEHLKKKTEGQFSDFFDDAKSFEISSTRVASNASHEAEGGPCGGSGASGEAVGPAVPLQLINDDDIPLGRAFEDLVHFDEKHYASQQHKISIDYQNYFNPTSPTSIIDQPDGKSATINDFMTNSSSTTPTDMWSTYLHGTLHASGNRESTDDSGKMGTSSGEMMPIFAGEIDLTPKNKRSSSNSSISDTDSISPYSSNDRLRLETKPSSGLSPKGGKKKTKPKFSPDDQPEKEPLHSKTHAYQKRYDSGGGDKHKDKDKRGGSSYRGQRTESKPKTTVHDKNEG